mmetsp:Transcript_15835/g.23832  ORF Transcript_15835/g.23832 Transcript_15835/m.23832 type:complete len:217 (+) Transcript_15835:285-935(+)
MMLEMLLMQLRTCIIPNFTAELSRSKSLMVQGVSTSRWPRSASLYRMLFERRADKTAIYKGGVGRKVLHVMLPWQGRENMNRMVPKAVADYIQDRTIIHTAVTVEVALTPGSLLIVTQRMSHSLVEMIIHSVMAIRRMCMTILLGTHTAQTNATHIVASHVAITMKVGRNLRTKCTETVHHGIVVVAMTDHQHSTIDSEVDRDRVRALTEASTSLS